MSAAEIFAWLGDDANLSWLSSIVTVIGFPIALIGLAAVAVQMKNDRLAVSAGAVGDIRNNMMERIERLSGPFDSDSPAADWDFECSELLNELELACAIFLDGQMKGRTGELAKQFVIDVMAKMTKSDDIRAHMISAWDTPNTFMNIRDFMKKVGRENDLPQPGESRAETNQPANEKDIRPDAGGINSTNVRV